MIRSMKNIVIVGAGDFSKEIYSWIINSEISSKFSVLGILDDSKAAYDSRNWKVPYLGKVDDIDAINGAGVVIGISDPTVRLKISSMYEKSGLEFPTIIHPSVLISEDVSIGKGVVLCPNVVVSYEAEISDFVHVNIMSSIGHHAQIRTGVTINSHCDITGKVVLETGVKVGSRAGVLPGVTVGEFATIASGSTVVKRVKSRKTVHGNPAKELF